MSYSLVDGRVVAKPSGGPNAGKPFEFQSGTKVSFDCGTKRTLAKGRRQRPIYTITQSAEPKLSIEFSSMKEYNRWWAFLQGGGAPVRGRNATFSHVFTREGVGTEAWRFLKVFCPAPDYEAGDSGVSTKKEFTLEDAHLNGVTIYEDA